MFEFCSCDEDESDHDKKRMRRVTRSCGVDSWLATSRIVTSALVTTCTPRCLLALETRQNRQSQTKARREDEVKLILFDVRGVHLNARCDEQAWVALPESLGRCGIYAR